MCSKFRETYIVAYIVGSSLVTSQVVSALKKTNTVTYTVE